MTWESSFDSAPLAPEAARHVDVICTRFERAWRRGNRLRIEEFLDVAADAERPALLRELIALEVELRLSRGEDPKPGEYRERFPGQTAVVDAALTATVFQPESNRPRPARDDTGCTATMSVGTTTNAGQRFRVLRDHARGGLGAVFVALDSELNREVALKEILDHHADDPTSRQRFLQEAEITGGLEHPGIVPIYGLGTYHGGRPFYAMRFVKGDSLKDAIARFHTEEGLTRDAGRQSMELRRLIRRFLDVCNTIGYAHGRGVLHRDIKPDNVIVGKHGETIVLDWGMAKATGRPDPTADEPPLRPSSASGSAQTLPGAALGTPAYMSPEQARGDLDALGPHSDVYSLGATLYCLLTGKAPFEGEADEVLRRVRAGDFPAPRRLDLSIDPALEALCLKAMATRPEDRYASCGALADDVERWTADEPVTAYAESLARRVRRWAERNRTAVTSAAVALVAGVVGLSAVLAVQTKANADLTRSKAAVQDRFELAVDAVKTFHKGVSEDFLLKEDQFKDLRDRLLKSAADFYSKLGARLGKETDVASRRALTDANFELADLTLKVGRSEDALAAHRAVLARREALAADPAVDPEAKADVGRSLTAVASILASTSRIDEAEAAYRKAEALLADLAGSPPSAPAALAACRTALGRLLASTAKKTDALAAYRLALAHQEAAVALPGASNETRHDLANTIFRIGDLVGPMGKLTEQEAAYREALSLEQKLVDDNPAVADYRYRLSAIRNNLGILLAVTRRSSEAESEYRKSMALIQELVDNNPAVSSFRGNLAARHDNLSTVLNDMGRLSEAEAETRKALALQQKLADDHPAVTEYRHALATHYQNLGFHLHGEGNPKEAEAAYRQGIALRRKLADDHPALTEFRKELTEDLSTLANLLRDTGRQTEAEAECRKRLALLRRLADDFPASTEFRWRLSDGHRNLGWLLYGTGRQKEAEAELLEAIATDKKLGADRTALPDFRQKLADSHANLGWLLMQRDAPSEAEPEYRQALAIWKELAVDYPKDPGYRLDAAWTVARFSALLRCLDRLAEARVYADRAVGVREALVKEYPGRTDDHDTMAETYFSRGLARRALGDAVGAAADVRRALELRDDPPLWGGWRCFESARYHAALAGLAGQAGSSASAGEAEAEKAMGLLRSAVDLGYRSAAFRNEDALDPLRSRDDFRLLMMDVAMPAEVFAR